MKRGEVWWATLPKPVGRRPVLLLSRNAAYVVRLSVTVAPITRTIHGIPVEVPLGPEDGLPKDCVVNLDGIVTIPKKSLDRSVTVLSPGKMARVAEAIKFALDLQEF
ncbi:MAG: type II toxin-antitoxin system PemK/MazF family toxin [Terriglobia bacterium]